MYVGNLAYSVNWQDLKDHMRQAGEVEHADVMMEGRGRSKGCGLVTYATAEGAANAIEQLHDSELNGRKIFVREDRESGQGGPRPPKRSNYGSRPSNSTFAGAAAGPRVYVGNLAWSVKWQDLKDHMKAAGNVVHADVMEESSGRSRGYGLVEYETQDEAQVAIDTLNNSELQGRPIFVREDREASGGSSKRIRDEEYGHDSSSTNKVFVGNLTFDTTEKDLSEHFGFYGTLTSVEVVVGSNGRSRGYGLVSFDTHEEAEGAIANLNQSNFKGRQLDVRFDRRS